MADAGTYPDAWKEVALVSVIPQLGTAQSFATMTEDITAMDFGDKDIEGLANVKGGRIAKFTPQGDESVTLKLYPITASLASATIATATGVVQWMHPQNGGDETMPIIVDNTLNRNKHGIIILWSEALPNEATTLPAASKTAYRIQVRNAYMTGYKPSFDDKTLSAEVTFKWTPFDKAGDANKREESTSGSAQLAATMTGATSF